MKKATTKVRGRVDGSSSAKRAATVSISTAHNAVQRIVAAGGKKFGKDVFNTFNGGSGCDIRKRYSTTVAVLDVALTRKVGEGFPGGRITEILGEEHCGKTTMCLLTLAATQKAHGFALLNDTESTTTPTRLKALGVDTNQLIYPELEYVEDVLNMMVEVARKSKTVPGVMLLDSVAGCMTRHEAGRDIGEQAIGRHAQAMSQGLRKLSQILKRTPVAVLFINQRKEGGIGNLYATERQKDATLGGKALKFHSQVRLRLLYMKRVSEKKEGAKRPVYIGDLIKATVIKDKERGSGTRACEVLLFIRKVGDGRGRFDNAMSCWHTLRYWDAVKDAKGGILFNSIKYSPDRWCLAYNTKESFRTQVHAMLETSAASLDEHGAVKKQAKSSKHIEDEDEEEAF